VIRDFHNLDTFLPHRDWLVDYCRRQRLTAGGDAEDLAQQVFERIQRHSPGEPVADPRAYLARSARNLAIGEWRKSSRRPEFTSLPDDLPLPREEDRHETARETWRQVEKAMPFLTPRQQQVFDASLKVADGELTREQASAALDITQAAFSGELRRLRDYVKAGLLVVLLIEQSDCRALARIVDGEPPSHQLGRAVHNHMATCRACQGRKPIIQGHVHKAVYVVPVGLFGIAGWLTAKKVAVGSVAAAVTGCAIVGSLLYLNDPGSQIAEPKAAPPVVTSSAVVPVADSPSVAQPPSGTLSSRPPSGTFSSQPPARLSATPIAAKPVPVTQAPQARTDQPLVITAGPDAIEHRRIVTPCNRRGGPTKSRVKVGVSAPGGVDSVRLRVNTGRVTTVMDMIGIGGNWYSQIGPYPDQLAGVVADATVEAVSTTGQRAQQNIGQVAVADCPR
jgi:RNA polymerase sigma factor (sigma-70 family)